MCKYDLKNKIKNVVASLLFPCHGFHVWVQSAVFPSDDLLAPGSLSPLMSEEEVEEEEEMFNRERDREREGVTRTHTREKFLTMQVSQ